jgi:Fe-S-cluster-containing hydrogenase component 2
VEALSRNPVTNAVEVDDDICVGCKVCTIACPFGTINYNKDTGKVIKCDLCGGDPQCAEVCPTDAITYVDANWTGYERMEQWALRGHGRPA